MAPGGTGRLRTEHCLPACGGGAGRVYPGCIQGVYRVVYQPGTPILLKLRKARKVPNSPFRIRKLRKVSGIRSTRSVNQLGQPGRSPTSSINQLDQPARSIQPARSTSSIDHQPGLNQD